MESSALSNQELDVCGKCGIVHNSTLSCTVKTELYMKWFFCSLFLAFFTSIIWGPLYCPNLYLAFCLFYSVLFCAVTLRMAIGYAFIAAGVRKAHLKKDVPAFDYHHLIIIPNYKETLHTLRTSLQHYASHQGSMSYIICLAMEEGEVGHEAKAKQLIAEFKSGFEEIIYTVHPRNLPGEAQGKGSNVNWAAKAAKRLLVDERGMSLDRIIITISDADSQFDSRYFGYVDSHMGLGDKENRHMKMFSPPTFFMQNSTKIPGLVRMMDVQWCGFAAASFGMHKGIGSSLSVYSLPMKLAQQVGWWDTGPGAMGEDMHMSLKCYFSTAGKVEVESVPYVVSQTNVQADTTVGTIKERWHQALRHTAGLQDSPYAMACAALAGADVQFSSRTWAWFMILFQGHFAPATNTLLCFSLNLFPILQPLYRVEAYAWIWFAIQILLVGATVSSLTFLMLSYHLTHNLLCPEHEKRSIWLLLRDIPMIPPSGMAYLIIPVCRAVLLMFVSSSKLSVYTPSAKPQHIRPVVEV